MCNFKIGYKLKVRCSSAAPHLTRGDHAAKDGALTRPGSRDPTGRRRKASPNRRVTTSKPGQASRDLLWNRRPGIYDRMLFRVTNASAITLLTAPTGAKVGGIFELLTKFLDEKFKDKFLRERPRPARAKRPGRRRSKLPTRGYRELQAASVSPSSFTFYVTMYLFVKCRVVQALTKLPSCMASRRLFLVD
jgi:hypothetical protein